MLDRGEATILALVVEGWDPVVAEIGLDLAGGASGSASAVKVHLETEAVTTHDGVNVTGNGAWVDDWVGALSDENTWAWEAEEGVDGGEGCREGECRDVQEAHLSGWCLEKGFVFVVVDLCRVVGVGGWG